MHIIHIYTHVSIFPNIFFKLGFLHIWFEVKTISILKEEEEQQSAHTAQASHIDQNICKCLLLLTLIHWNVQYWVGWFGWRANIKWTTIHSNVNIMMEYKISQTLMCSLTQATQIKWKLFCFVSFQGCGLVFLLWHLLDLLPWNLASIFKLLRRDHLGDSIITLMPEYLLNQARPNYSTKGRVPAGFCPNLMIWPISWRLRSVD